MKFFEILSSIFMLSCSILGIICSLLLISVMITVRRHCTPIVVISLNTAVAGFVINTIYASQAIYQMISDSSDVLCVFRGFLLHTSTGLFYHTLCIQAIYRLFVTVFAQRRNLQSNYTIIPIVVIQWIISSSFGIPILLTRRIRFYAEGRICQVSINNIFGFMYLGTFIYFLPLSIIIYIYITILNYTKRNITIPGVRQRMIAQTRHRRELRITRRILILVFILFITGFPYAVFFLQANVYRSSLWPYGHRISFIFIAFGQALGMLSTLVKTYGTKCTLLKTLSQR
ncbi:unnamed protein product [Adineta steineri]|uniref:G-protein coupled receptors family 1 profile domain-containing protein n=1 Tax=Adineta steineri TaxID=433720 RepID=A0A814NMD2_9BILA|nr:unnamed protein product [Adineta steineri]